MEQNKSESSVFYKCQCSLHLLEYEYDKKEDSHYISFWTHGVHSHKPSFIRRFREAWRLLTGKSLNGFWGVILSDEDAQRLSSNIKNSSLRKKSL